MKRWGILLVEVYERVGNLSFRSVKRPKKGYQMPFMAVTKSRKRSGFVV